MQLVVEVEDCLRALNEGRFDVRVESSGSDDELASNVNELANRLQALSSEMHLMKIDLADEGRFGGQIEIPDPQGDWETLVNDVNLISRSLTIQFRAIALVITAIANGDFSVQLTADGRGEFKELKDTINIMGGQFAELAVQITCVVRAVGADQPCAKIDIPCLAGTWKDLASNVDTMAADLGLHSHEAWIAT